MIDKKPFRVTNEQAKEDVKLSCEHETCYICQFDKPCRSIESYAADLLDARELIDKQEAIIKEMRNLIYGAASYNVDCSCQSCQNVKIGIRETLVKTKDYA